MQMQNELDIQAYLEPKGIQIKRRSGNELIINCLFCEDTKAHLYIHSQTSQYFCHKCNAKGNIFTLMNCFGDKPAHRLTPEERKQIEHKEHISKVLNATVDYYHSSLPPEAKDYLQKRGFTETINKAKIGYANGGLRAYLAKEDFDLRLCQEAGVVKEKNGKDYFWKRIVFPVIKNGCVVNLTGRPLDDQKPKWLHLPGPIDHLYNEDALLGSKEVFVCEGIPDTLILSQWNYKAVGVLGAGGFREDWINRFEACEIVYLCFDPDKAGQDGVMKVAELLGEKARIVSLPQGMDMNDWMLAGHKKEDFERLRVEAKGLVEYLIFQIPTTDKPYSGLSNKLKPVITQINLQNPIEQEVTITLLKDRFGLAKEAIRKMLGGIGGGREANIREETKTVLSANIPGLIDIGIDDNGDVAYIVKVQDRLQIAPIWEVDGIAYTPPTKNGLPFKLPRAIEVLKWHQSDNDYQLFDDLIAYLKQFSYLPDNLWLIVACKVLLTYIQDHPDIYYLPELLFWAVPERGKSRTGKAVTYVSYRGIHLVELREANLFRYSQDMRATLFFDIMNLWKKAERNGVEDILLLRFEKGAKASRVLYPEKGAFRDMVHYDIYGPTLIATNEAVHKILNTRCILITMPNRPGKYENPEPEKAQELKERLTAWRATVIDRPLPEIETIQGIDGRLWDISEPLLQVCKLICPEKLQVLKEALLEVAGQRIEEKKAGIEWQIISALYELSPDEEVIPEWQIMLSKVLERLNENRPEDKKLTPQYLGRKLKAMGIKTRHIHGYSEILLIRTEFNTLLIQFGIIDPLPCEEILLLSTKLAGQEKSIACGGRQLVERCQNSTQTLPGQVLENKDVLNLVESGRELVGSLEERNKTEQFEGDLTVDDWEIVE